MTTDINQHIIKDPVYGAMSASAAEHELLKPFIDHPLMQRLRHIKQLSFVDLIFPGAVHTRFNHSLGCSYLSGRIYKQLFPEIESIKLNKEHRLIILAGLLHDIGHGPFSHVFEQLQIFSNDGLKDDEITHDSIKHEDWFKLFIDEMFKDPGIKKHINFKNDLIDIFNGKYKNPWVKQIISSQLDADRMDYILRDAHFCGVKYGTYDLEWLISCLSLNNEDIVITEKGIGSVEQFLHARSLMHQNVYYHIKSSAIAKCVIDLLEHLIKKPSLVKKVGDDSLYNFLQIIKNHKDLPLNKPNRKANKIRLMKKLFPYYSQLTDYDIWLAIRTLSTDKKSNTVCHKLARNLYNRQLPKAYPIDPDVASYIEKTIADNNIRNKTKFESWQLKVVPMNVTFYKESNEPIYVIDKKGVKRKLPDASLTISNLNNQNHKICFLYVDRELENNISVKKLISECNKKSAFIHNKEKR